eukprot:TRINITY_DN3358_c0_g2_i1.p1 TRINITY_DN3358_c0_g2~~TRINITY_DN3358_c0_g2_i1.p1  ORF type:complete len:508 (-),score=82.21 TRINITY_DN3358_c0_g2_i1:111-1634(-)
MDPKLPSQLGYDSNSASDIDGMHNSYVRMASVGGSSWQNSAASSMHSVYDEDDSSPSHSPLKARAGLVIVFLANAGLSVVTPSLWFFLSQDLQSTHKVFLGVVIAAFNLGQVVGAPFLEKWAERRNAKEVLLVSLLLTAIGEFWYALSNNAWYIPAARFITGFGAANQTVVQYYMSSVVPPEDREARMRQLALFSVCSFGVGPLIGAGLALVNFSLFNGLITVDQYNVAGFFSGFMAVINILIVLIVLSVRDTNPIEDKTSATAANTMWRAAQLHFVTHVQPLLPLLLCIVVIYFFVFNAGAVFEAMITPFTEYTFGWGVQENEFLWTGCGLLSVVAFISLPVFSNFLNDRQILLIFLVLLTAGFGSLIYQEETIVDQNGQSVVTHLPLWRFIIGIILISYSFPGCMTQCIAVYAQVLSSPPQGVTLWILTGGGVAARLMGPLWSGVVVDISKWPTVFITTTSGLVLAILLLLLCWKKVQLLVYYNDPRTSRASFGSFHALRRTYEG